MMDTSQTSGLPTVEIYTDGGCEPNPGGGWLWGGDGSSEEEGGSEWRISENDEQSDGNLCRSCRTRSIETALQSQVIQRFGVSYYEFNLWCPKCEIAYQVESAKRFIEHPPSLF